MQRTFSKIFFKFFYFYNFYNNISFVIFRKYDLLYQLDSLFKSTKYDKSELCRGYEQLFKSTILARTDVNITKLSDKIVRTIYKVSNVTIKLNCVPLLLLKCS